MAEKYLWEIMKGMGHLEDIVKDTNSVEYNRVFKLYAAGTQMNSYLNDKWEEKTPEQHIKGLMLGQMCQMLGRTLM